MELMGGGCYFSRDWTSICSTSSPSAEEEEEEEVVISPN